MDSPAHPVDELGVTRLQNTCGHIFCRKELRVFGFSSLTNMLMLAQHHEVDHGRGWSSLPLLWTVLYLC